MTLTSTDCNSIIIDSDLINSFQTTPENYNSITITGKLNEGTEYSQEYTTTIASGGDYIRSVDGVETILSTFFGDAETLSDGIYTIVVTTIDTDDVAVEEQGCIFKDCSDLKCDIASKDAMYYYYVLENNCSCNCSKLYTIYEALLAELEKPVSNESNCGCV
jgi:hypothetical protein